MGKVVLGILELLEVRCAGPTGSECMLKSASEIAKNDVVVEEQGSTVSVKFLVSPKGLKINKKSTYSGDPKYRTVQHRSRVNLVVEMAAAIIFRS